MEVHHSPDAQHIEVTISEDKLTAFLRWRGGQPINTITVSLLEEVLNKHDVTYGLLEEKLALFAANPNAYTKQPLPVAKGDPPLLGTDGSVRYLFQLDQDAPKPNVLEDGRVDYREVRKINNVKKGQVIAERVPAQEGQPGTSVSGSPLPPPKAKEAFLKPGKNVVLDEERTRMYAVIDGMVSFTENDRVNVFPVFEVNGDVDFRSGNIDFVGNVVIRGNVLTGFVVKAEGDIRITGSVEGATITAGGSIDIAGGVVGHHKGLVQAGHTIYCSFIQDATVEAGEDLIVSQSIMHSNVRAGMNVICTGSKGLIVGGAVQAGETVEAKTVGNMSHTPTSIEVGVHPQHRNELKQLQNEMRQIADNLDKTNKALILLEGMAKAGTLTEDRKQMFIKLQRTKAQLLDQQAENGARIVELEEILEGIEQAKVVVHDIIYGGSRILIGRYTRYIKDAAQHVIFRFEDGEIMMHAKF